MAPRGVVLCADDFGLTEGVSQGILDLGHMGRISATSAMTNRPWWGRLARRLDDLKGEVAAGLHLTLTLGEPLGPAPHLAPGGRFLPLSALLPRLLAGRVPTDEIFAEIERQLDAFEQALGRPPAFVDGHQHVHVLPGVRRMLLRALRRRGHEVLWLRDPSDRARSIVRRRHAAGKAFFVRSLSLGFARAAQAAGFSTNQGFSGFSRFDPAADAEALFHRAFLRLGPSPLVMCHPGYVDEELERLDPVTGARSRELMYLSSTRFPELLELLSLRLATRPPGL